MEPPDGAGELQFEHVKPLTTPSVTGAAAKGVTCVGCERPLDRDYFDVNGQVTCQTCSEAFARHAETPRGPGALGRAGLFGFVAALLGAALYFAVIAITHLEVGLVAIAIGYMVGYAVRRGTHGRGGRRFQILALVLTYWSVGLAYSSLAIQELVASQDGTASAAASIAPGPGEPSAATPAPAPRPTGADTGADDAGDGRLWFGVLQLLAFTLAFPVMVVAGSLPGSLISAAIIAFGMRQAWQMTGAPRFEISGPYRIGSPSPAATG
jgi:hypothetical protein